MVDSVQAWATALATAQLRTLNLYFIAKLKPKHAQNLLVMLLTITELNPEKGPSTVYNNHQLASCLTIRPRGRTP